MHKICGSFRNEYDFAAKDDKELKILILATGRLKMSLL